MTEEMIICPGNCGQDPKPASMFVHKQSGQRTKLCEVCRGHSSRSMKKRKAEWWPKRQEYNRAEAFGLKPGQYEQMLEDQKGRCAICGRSPEDLENKKALAVDHDHVTNTVRGLLCGQCNVGLGMLQDSPVILQKAIDYLTGFRDPIEL